MNSQGVVVFDMDGVLVDVSDSYRETIRQTVRRFTGKEITRELVQDYKNAGGWNNDWALSRKIIEDLGVTVDYTEVVQRFQSIFLGERDDGLILRERWTPEKDLLDRLQRRFQFAIFTGRPRHEVAITLNRFIPSLEFAAIVADEDVANPKPAPDGLEMIAARFPASKLWYVGDTVDDARSARAANVQFIGIAEPANPRRSTLVSLLAAEGAIAVLDNVNQLESVL
ncbi:MAG TPA: HAD hydrolase-like protein [Bryobacteraceae bacterium]|nr:HAD hydrolase-like protein [Bryobacteraceae bacterium]